MLVPKYVPIVFGKFFLESKKELARKKISERVKFFSEKYWFKPGNIRIKNNKTNWGSCSSKGNLNFNYKIIYLKLEEADYIVVHELCHLREMNHSKRFWKEVENIIPDYKKIMKNIKEDY